MLRKFISFSVLGLAALISGVMLRAGTHEISVERKIFPALLHQDDPLAPRSEGIPSRYRSPMPPDSLGKNFTKEFAELLSKSILSKNQEGPQTIGKSQKINVPTGSFIEGALEKAVRDFNPNSLRPAVDENRLLVMSASSKEEAATYLRQAQSIIRNMGEGLSVLNHDTSLQELQKLDHIIELYASGIDSLYALRVPADLKELHSEEISLLGAQKEIFARIKNYENDPLASALALNARGKIDEALETLKGKFASYIIEHNITE